MFCGLLIYLRLKVSICAILQTAEIESCVTLHVTDVDIKLEMVITY